LGRGKITPQSQTEKDISGFRDFSLDDALRQLYKSRLLGTTIKLLQSPAGKSSSQWWEGEKVTSEQKDIWQSERLQTIGN